MLHISTVLILGAGASHDFGFPCGRKLLHDIVGGLNRGNYVRAVCEQEFKAQFIEAFQSDLLRSGKMSVDEFLEHNSKYLDIGKICIATVLIAAEQENKLFAYPNHTPWYEYLVRILNCKKNDFARNQLKIITFNYDRSLEHFLFNSFKSTHGISHEEAIEMLDHLNILHVHGDLNGGVNYGSENCRPYTPDTQHKAVKAAAFGIKIIHETDAEKDVAFIRSREAIHEAEKIVCLGFGFAPQNIRKLRLHRTRKDQELYASTKNLRNGNIAEAKALFERELTFGAPNDGILDFLNEVPIFNGAIS